MSCFSEIRSKQINDIFGGCARAKNGPLFLSPYRFVHYHSHFSTFVCSFWVNDHCLLTTQCFDALAGLEDPERQVSLLRFSCVLGRCGLLITAALLQISPLEVLAHYLEKHAFYEPRNDRKNFCQHLTEIAGGLT